MTKKSIFYLKHFLKHKWTKILIIGLHVLFCIGLIYFFYNNSFIRPSTMMWNPYKEIVSALFLLSAIYLNYLVICPVFFKKRNLKTYIFLSILLIVGTATSELLLVKSEVIKCLGSNGPDFISKYLRYSLLIISLRNGGFYFFFTLLGIYQYTVANAWLEKKETLKSGLMLLPSLRGNPISFNINHVSYFSQNENYTTIHVTFGKPISIYSSLSYIQDYLDEYCLRINKTNIVIFRNIISYNDESVKVKEGKNNAPKSLPFYKNGAKEIFAILQKKLPDLEEKNRKDHKKTEVDNISDDKKSETDNIRQALLEEIRKNPGSNALQLFQIFPKTLSLVTFRRRLKDLTDSGLIEFRGARKSGGYYLVAASK